MKHIITVAAFVALGTAAHAQDAFITQVGDGNAGANVQTVAPAGGNVQVIQQVGETGNFFGNAPANNNAVQLVRGSNNDAFTYQDTSNGAGGSNTSLIIQTEDYDFGLFVPVSSTIASNNTAITVQDQSSGPFGHNFVAQTLQVGDNNTAINWQETMGFSGNAVGILNPTLHMPTLTQTATPAAVPTGYANVPAPLGGSVAAY
ncbi:hypothetical protein IV417_10435 [Alphaproteobacteria bacterium KMM 3653]|uniref:Curlin associated repeat-containing protein n=1 Tax=Harenicola maris TaxID=2841044 RepID=A0AAP2G8C8_9RHOB|nr:hypothetical protein [Harenicola maris]